MMSHFYDAELPALIKSGRVSMATVDESVRRVLRVKFALGLFDHPYPTQPEVTAAVPEHRPLVRQAAEESFVLLQNKAGAQGPVLPLSAGVKLALIGPLADNANEMLGSWGGARKSIRRHHPEGRARRASRGHRRRCPLRAGHGDSLRLRCRLRRSGTQPRDRPMSS